MTTVHQVIPVLARRDAVGAHTLQVRDALRAAGHDSEIFAEIIVDELQQEAHLLEEFDRLGEGSDLILYQASTGSTAGDWLMGRDEPLAVNYHNVTPAQFFDVWDPAAAAVMRWGRNQIRVLARRSVVALADSAFNAAELSEAGYEPVEVAPLLVEPASRRATADQAAAAHLSRLATTSHWLFVGRLAPNKCQHDIIGAFAVYRRVYDATARLTLVGSPALISYRDSLLALSDELGVDDAVTFVQTLNDAELRAYYEAADVFVCLSRHEGFCLPVLEAMASGTPVVALAAAAVPDTVGDAGLLLPDSDPVLVATAVQRLLADDRLRSQLVSAGHRVAGARDLGRDRETFLNLLLDRFSSSPPTDGVEQASAQRHP